MFKNMYSSWLKSRLNEKREKFRWRIFDSRPRTLQISRKRFERSRVTRSFHYVANKVSRRFHYIRAPLPTFSPGETPERCLPFTRNNDILRSSPATTPLRRKRQFELQIHVRHFTIVTSSP